MTKTDLSQLPSEQEQNLLLPKGFNTLTNDQMSRIKGGFDEDDPDDDGTEWEDDVIDPPEEPLEGEPGGD